MRLFNYLTRRIESFKPLKPNQVSLYTCGPTVYDYAHIGNLRTYVFEDLLHRTLKYLGFQVTQVMNITDIEDKIVQRARQEGVEFTKITHRYQQTFQEDLQKLNILPAKEYPRVTEHIAQIIRLIKTLIKKGYAYQAEDGSVYFKISQFPRYGELAQLQQQTLVMGASGRVFSDEYSKEELSDFVLWKAKSQAKEPNWDSPWGRGRPGWHIECSALAMEYLGEQIDIHAGAIDLIFPHHTNEIAQSEAATGKKFVNYWVEGEHLLVDGQKMSKSLGNYYTLREIEKKGFDALAFRYLILQTHYRKKLNFTWPALEAAQKALGRLRTNLALLGKGNHLLSGHRPNANYLNKFRQAISHDLNLPQALAITWELAEDPQISAPQKLSTLLNFDQVLGLQLRQAHQSANKIPQEIKKLLKRREELRALGRYKQADQIRQTIYRQGFTIHDTPSGPSLTPKD